LKNKVLPTLIVDSREKKSWDFEGDEAFAAVKHHKLDGGDYSIEGLEDIIVIERKATVDELFGNFSKDKARIRAEFERLRPVKFRFFIIEESFDNIMNPLKYYINKRKINKRHPKMPVAVVAAGLNDLMLNYGVHVLFGGNNAQALARSLLLKAFELYNDS
jgi:ERCC4-type nuclease